MCPLGLLQSATRDERSTGSATLMPQGSSVSPLLPIHDGVRTSGLEIICKDKELKGRKLSLVAVAGGLSGAEAAMPKPRGSYIFTGGGSYEEGRAGTAIEVLGGVVPCAAGFAGWDAAPAFFATSARRRSIEVPVPISISL